MKKLLILCCLLATIPCVLSAQVSSYRPQMDAPKITPPSPNSASLGKYGDIPVGLYTGIPKISIPLYELKLGTFSLPISVSYHSQGLKVEEKSGNVGFQWALNAGGVITRTVKGLPDEQTLGYWGQAGLTNSYISSNQGITHAFCGGEIDAQPDIYYFNFGGYSGKFVLDASASHTAHIIPAQASLKINVVGSLGSFQVTDDKGIKYIFDVKETTTDDNNPPKILSYTSSWYLSKIITPAGEINFSYTSEETYFYQHFENDHLNAEANIDAATFNPGQKIANNYITVDSRILTSINSPVENIDFYTMDDRKDMLSAKRITGFLVKDYNGSTLKKVSFIQSYFGNSATTSPEDCRLKLDQIVEFSDDSALAKTYAFAYESPALVPSIKSLSQDYWGYFNGKSNSSLLPYMDPRIHGFYIANQAVAYGNRDPDVGFARIGCLNRITYPTGGTTAFLYEGNDYSSVSGLPVDEEKQTQKQAISTATRTSTVNIPTKNTSFTIGSSQVVLVTTQGSYSGAPPVDNGPSIYINRINANGTRTSMLSRNMINSKLSSTLWLEVGNYEIIASVDGVVQTATGSISYYSVDGRIYTKAAGGFRIKQILNTDPVTSKTTVKQYEYRSVADTSKSSGVLVTKINLLSKKIAPRLGNDTYYWMVRSSATSNYLGTTQGAFIGYGTVTEKEGSLDKGKKISYFTTASTYPNTYGTVNMVPFQDQITGSNNSDYLNNYLDDYDAYRGYLIKEMFFNESNHLVLQTDIKYNLTEALSPNSTNYFELNSKAGLLVNTCRISCGQCGGTDNCLPWSINGYYIFDNKIICPWIYKQQVSDKQYDVNGLNPVEALTNYYYGNPSHGLVTTEELITSKGTVFKKINKYAQDKGQINGLTTAASLSIDSMVSKNMVSDIIETEEYTNDIFNSRTRTNYRIWDSEGLIVAPENMQSQTGLNNALENRVQFINYDSKGNLLEVSKANGPHMVYQWGYKNQYPIAQVINASSNNFFYNGFEETEGNSSVDDSKTGRYSHLGSYSKTLTGLGNGNYYLSYWKKTGTAWVQVISTITVSSGVYQINLSDQIDDIRFYPVNSQVNSYTYRPLVGVTSITDAKGMTTYYEYDSFQRLKSVKDQNGNILKQTDYHYNN